MIVCSVLVFFFWFFFLDFVCLKAQNSHWVKRQSVSLNKKPGGDISHQEDGKALPPQEKSRAPKNCSINYSNYSQPAGVFFKFSITSWSWNIVTDNLSPRWGDYSLNFCVCLSAKPQRNLSANGVSGRLVLRPVQRFKYGDKWLLDCCKQTIIISAFRLRDKAAGFKYRNCVFAVSHSGQGRGSKKKKKKKVAVVLVVFNFRFSSRRLFGWWDSTFVFVTGIAKPVSFFFLIVWIKVFYRNP